MPRHDEEHDSSEALALPWLQQLRQHAYSGGLKIVDMHCGAVASGDCDLGAACVPCQAAVWPLQLQQPQGAAVRCPATREAPIPQLR